MGLDGAGVSVLRALPCLPSGTGDPVGGDTECKCMRPGACSDSAKGDGEGARGLMSGEASTEVSTFAPDRGLRGMPVEACDGKPRGTDSEIIPPNPADALLYGSTDALDADTSTLEEG